jgi:hypothetical protein
MNSQLDWSPKLRQAVKAQISSNEEESLEFVKKEVHEGIQAGHGAAAGDGRVSSRGGARLRN